MSLYKKTQSNREQPDQKETEIANVQTGAETGAGSYLEILRKEAARSRPLHRANKRAPIDLCDLDLLFYA